MTASRDAKVRQAGTASDRFAGGQVTCEKAVGQGPCNRPWLIRDKGLFAHGPHVGGLFCNGIEWFAGPCHKRPEQGHVPQRPFAPRCRLLQMAPRSTQARMYTYMYLLPTTVLSSSLNLTRGGPSGDPHH